MIGDYIFLIPSIAEVGGGEFYVANKAQYLQSIGYKVIIISTRKKKVTIPFLKKYESFIWPELEFPFSATPNKVIDALVIRLRQHINNKKVIFESNMITLSPWGEYFASLFKAKHIAYPLSEGFPKLTPSLESFFKFKLDQHLLFGINPKSIAMLLGERKEIVNTWLPAVGCTYNQVQDVDLPKAIKVQGFDFNILCLGRLSKGYVKAASESVSLFAKANNNKNIQFILVGDDCTISEKRNLENIFSENPNLHFVFTGALTPLPSKIFKIANVAIAGAGCVYICRRKGLLTISVDANDHAAIGIFDVTTQNTLYRDNEPSRKIEDLLYEILIQKSYPSLNEIKEIEPDYSQHLAIINKQYCNSYYNVLTIKNNLRYRVLKFLYSIFGFRIVKFLMDKYVKIYK